MALVPIPLALYVHIPFCAYRCRYCNFTFETGWSPGLLTRTLETLHSEAEALVRRGETDGLTWKVQTLYLGGGTPSVIPPGQMAWFLAGLEGILGYKTAELRETTVEMNPENVTREYLETLQAAGVNRISLGIQTFDSDRLALLGRWCDRSVNLRALDLLADHWPGRWSADLMTGLPGQGTLPPQRWIDVRADLNTLLSFQPGHISLYSLTVEPETDLATLRAGGGVQIADEPVADQLWIRSRQTLIDRGYEWYEISNFARPGCRSLHNQAYWRMDPWAGLGPGAEGTLPFRDPEGRLVPVRTRNPRLFPWLTGQRTVEHLSGPEFALEHYLAGWRTSDGVVSGRMDDLFDRGHERISDRLKATDRLALNRFLSALPDLSAWSLRRDWP